MKALFAVLLCCAPLFAKGKPEPQYVYQNGTLKSFQMVNEGSSCVSNGNTTGQVNGSVDEGGDVSGNVKANTTTNTTCVPRKIAYYTIAVGSQTLILTPSVTKREGITALATLGYSRLFQKNSVLYDLPPGTPIQVRAKGTAIYVKVGSRESKYRIDSVSANVQPSVSGATTNRGGIPPTLLSKALAGDVKAESAIGGMYASGQGVPKDYALAAVWDRKAAEQGDIRSEVALGAIYFMGQGVQRDYAQAALWWNKASGQGSATAQYALGMMYANGQGVPQDYAQAYYWYSLADRGDVLTLNHKQVDKDRAAAASHLSPQQLTQVKKRVRQWLASHRGVSAAK